MSDIQLGNLTLVSRCTVRSHHELLSYEQNRPFQEPPHFDKLLVIKRPYSAGRLVELTGPSVDDGMLVDVVDGGHDAVLELLLGGDADMPKHLSSHSSCG